MSEPTATELDAALAEVRVRAVPIARRRARNRSAGLALSVLLVGALGAAVGRATAPGLSLTPDEEAWAHGIGGWSVTRAPAPAGDAPGPIWRWHVTTEDVLEGVRLNTGESWIEGPQGTFFDVTLSSFSARYNGSVRAAVAGDSTNVRVRGTVTNALGTSRGAKVRAVSQNTSDVWLRRGESVLVRPFGTSGEVTTTIRIHGPFAAAPEGSVRWFRPDTLRVMPALRPGVALQASLGIRHANRGSSALSIVPVYIPSPSRLRFTLRGQAPSEVVAPPAGAAVQVRIPGLEPPAVVVTEFIPDGLGATCVLLRAAIDGQFIASGCFMPGQPWRPIEIRLPQTERRLQIEQLRR